MGERPNRIRAKSPGAKNSSITHYTIPMDDVGCGGHRGCRVAEA
jgi:hypothetical protein